MMVFITDQISNHIVKNYQDFSFNENLGILKII